MELPCMVLHTGNQSNCSETDEAIFRMITKLQRSKIYNLTLKETSIFYQNKQDFQERKRVDKRCQHCISLQSTSSC